MDKYKIDGHKLNHHLPRVVEWLEKGDAYPIYMEVSPSGACNHRCTFCALDFMDYQKRYIDIEIYSQRLKEFAACGLKSIMYAGEGEPFMHKEFVRMVRETKENGIDVAITTNASLMKKEVASEILPRTEWIKVSINAGTAESYAKIHRTQEIQFSKVLENIGNAVELKRSRGDTCTIGLQLVLLPDNLNDVEDLARIGRDLGCDYLVVKPYSQHPQSITETYREITYKEAMDLDEVLKSYETDSYKVLFRKETMKIWDESDRGYEKCQALPFWSYLDAGGSIWGCSMYLEDERFLYGNIYKESFQEIWNGERRKKSQEFVLNDLDISQCRINCRMDKINRYLWDLSNPPEHVNFI